MSSTSKEPVGLVAGWGQFPITFARKARDVGRPVVCVGLKNEALPELKPLVSRYRWAAPFQLGKMIRFFKREGVSRMVFAGKVHKGPLLYHPWRFLWLLTDWRTLKMFYSHLRRGNDTRDDSIMLRVIREINKDGITVESALDLCPELLVECGCLTRRQPTAKEEQDVEFGWDIARKMGELDVGQSVMIKDRNVLAVEAVEGTDQAIQRAGELCRAGGFTVVKVAKPNQDMRFDVPTVGTQTIEVMKKANARVLAIEAKLTIVLEQEATIALANKYGITIVAR